MENYRENQLYRTKLGVRRLLRARKKSSLGSISGNQEK